MTSSLFSLNALEAIIAQRAMVNDGSSYTASLVAGGLKKATKKLGEEASEAIIAALVEDKESLVNESADLIYHLLVVWHLAGISVDDVMDALAKRTKQSGLDEKKSRAHERPC